MDLTRAQSIVSAINDRAFTTMDLPADMASLADVSLADMIEAKRLVQDANEAAVTAAKGTGERYTIRVVPDDRLIAAVYAIEHYPCSNTAVLALPQRAGRHKALAVLSVADEGVEAVT
jgi:ferritin-like metal-binding protein YciE